MFEGPVSASENLAFLASNVASDVIEVGVSRGGDGTVSIGTIWGSLDGSIREPHLTQNFATAGSSHAQFGQYMQPPQNYGDVDFVDRSRLLYSKCRWLTV